MVRRLGLGLRIDMFGEKGQVKRKGAMNFPKHDAGHQEVGANLGMRTNVVFFYR